MKGKTSDSALFPAFMQEKVRFFVFIGFMVGFICVKKFELKIFLKNSCEKGFFTQKILS